MFIILFILIIGIPLLKEDSVNLLSVGKDKITPKS